MLLRHAVLTGLLLFLSITVPGDSKADDDGAAGEAAAAPGPAGSAAERVAPALPAMRAPVPTMPSLVPEALPERFKRWLREVDPLITRMERDAFLALRYDYHRDAFIRKFWQERDPYPETGRNELKENWDERVFQAESEFETLDDDRARILLVHGPP